MSLPFRGRFTRALLLGGALCTLSFGTAAAGPVMDVGADVRRMLWEDLPACAAAPASWASGDWTRLALAAAVVGAVGLADGRVRSVIPKRSTPLTRRVSAGIRGAGDVFGPAGLSAAAVYATGILADSREWRGLGFEMLEAAAFTSLAVAGLKVVVGRARPDRGEGPWSFQWFGGGVTGGHSSFPSQHAATAFSLAGVVSARVPRGGWWAWPLAGLVAASRVHDDAHWASDVVAGALLGTAVARWVVARSDRDRVAWIPWAGRDWAGAVCRIAF